MKLDNSLLRITPKTFQAINIHFALTKPLPMINSQMQIATKYQGIITSKSISINDQPSSNSFDRQVENRLSTDVSKDMHLHPSLSLQDAESRDFVASSSAPSPLASTSKMGLIGLNFYLQKLLLILAISRDGLPKKVKGPKHCRIRKTQLLRSLSGRDLQFKELDQPEPLFGRDFNLINPSSGEVREHILTLAAAVARISDEVQFFVPTTNTETKAIVPIGFLRNLWTRLSLLEEFKGLKIHRHHCNL